MSHEVKIHEAQTKILRELLFLPATNFAGLQRVSGLEPDHAKFHIKRLVELGYVDKQGAKYLLSIKGKEYANKLDTDAGVIERQPKVAVMLVVERLIDNKKHYLVQQRLKHPLYGFWGCPTGKVRWGESIYETASRELYEETKLKSEFEFSGEYHERVVHGTTGEIVEDKIFHVMFTDKAEGEPVELFEGGRNAWRTMEDMQTEQKRYKSFDLETKIGINRGPKLTEQVFEYTDSEF
jgi:ADP-ribose pyrophosphatase YjhB (NUDIX family)